MGSEVVFDRIMKAMADRYRRRLLFRLQESNPQNADDPQRWATDGPEADTGPESTVRSMMYHSHLPKLDEMGYISWDREAGTISKGPKWAEIAPFIRLLDDHGDQLSVEWL